GIQGGRAGTGKETQETKERLSRLFFWKINRKKGIKCLGTARFASALVDNRTCKRTQKASISRRLTRASNMAPRPPIAFLLMRVAKFLGPSSSAPEGGP